MPNVYTTLTQFLRSYDGRPFIWASITDGTTTHRVARKARVLENSGGDIFRAKNALLNSGGVSAMVGEEPEFASVTLNLDGIEFNTSLLMWAVVVYLGDPRLLIDDSGNDDQHLTLFTGTIAGESRDGRAYSVTVTDDIQKRLNQEYFPKFTIEDDTTLATTAPDDSLSQPVPIVFGQLLSTGTGALGRLRAVAITSNGAGVANDFLVCQVKTGDTFTLGTVYQNGSAIGAPATSEVAGSAFTYRKITINPSNHTDEILLDVTVRSTDPVDELYFFLTDATYLGFSATTIPVASFDTAQDICDARGYVLGGAITTSTSAIQIISDWLRSSAAQIMSDAGIIKVRIRDYSTDLDAEDITEAAHIIEDSLSINFELSNLFNAVVYDALFDADGAPLLRGLVENGPSITTYERRETSRVMPWCGNAATAKDIAQRFVFDNKDPRRRVALRTGLIGMDLDLTGDIRITGENLERAYCEIERRNLSAFGTMVGLDCVDIDDLVAEAFYLSAEEQLSADAPHDLELDSVYNPSVVGSIDDAGTFGNITPTVPTNILTADTGSFAAAGVKVGDLFKINLAGHADIGYYEVFEGVVAIGTVVTTALTLTVQNPITAAAVTFASAVAVTDWWIVRRHETSTDNQKRLGYLVKGGLITAFAAAPAPRAATHTLVTSNGHTLLDTQGVFFWDTTNYNSNDHTEYTVSQSAANTFEIELPFAANDAQGWWAETEYEDGTNAKRLV